MVRGDRRGHSALVGPRLAEVAEGQHSHGPLGLEGSEHGRRPLEKGRQRRSPRERHPSLVLRGERLQRLLVLLRVGQRQSLSEEPAQFLGLLQSQPLQGQEPLLGSLGRVSPGRSEPCVQGRAGNRPPGRDVAAAADYSSMLGFLAPWARYHVPVFKYNMLFSYQYYGIG